MPIKDDMMKRFNAITKRLKEITEVGHGGANEEDAMFTRKPYGPAACASCEKGLINIQGLPVDYHTWKKMPIRQGNDRIARYGQGFSKLLSNIQLNEESL